MSALQSTPLIGLPQLTGWSQVAVVADHHLWVAFAVAGQNAGNVGRDLLSWLQTQQPSSTPSVHTLLTQLLSLARDKACDLQVALAWQNETQVVFGAIKGAVILKRPTKVGVVLHSSGDVQLVEGRLQADDVVVLMTAQASNYLGEIQQKLGAGFDVDTVVTNLVPSIHSQPDSSLTACAFLAPAQPQAEPSSERVHGPFIEMKFEPDPPDDEPSASRMPTPSTHAAPSRLVHANQETSLRVKKLPWPVIGFSIVKRLLRRMVGLPLAWWRFSLRFRHDDGLRRRVIILGLLAVIASSSLGGGLWWWQTTQAKQRQAADAVVQPLLDKLQVAEQQSENDPLTARQLANEVLTELTAAQGQFEKQPAAKKVVAAALAQAQATTQNLSGQKEANELPIFYDSRLLQSDFVATLALSKGTTAWLVDTGKRQALILDLERKQARLFDLSKMSSVVDVAIDGDTVWLLGDGLWRTKLTDPSDLTQVKPAGESNQAGTHLAAYNSYVYVVNPEKRNIYRYAKVSDTEYSDPIGWLQSSQGFSLSEATSISIDGDVWLGLQTGRIAKLTSGKPAEFNPQGLQDALAGDLEVVTDPDTKNLYVLDADKERVVVLSKDGTFLKELRSPMLGASTHLLVSESLNKALAVSGSLLFELEL